MNNILLNRIQNQLIRPHNHTQVKVQEPNKSDSLTLESLKTLLEKELEEKVPKVVEVNELVFENVFEFCDWYIPRREQFSEAQKIPLDTLIQTRDMIGQGCKCRRSEREQAAFQYFKIFWENNAKTDLINTILKLGNVQRIKFSNFLVVP